MLAETGNFERPMMAEWKRGGFMNEFTKKIVIGILIAAVFIVCVALVVIGQRNIGVQGLFTQLLGLFGLVGLLWLYNRQYK